MSYNDVPIYISYMGIVGVASTMAVLLWRMHKAEQCLRRLEDRTDKQLAQLAKSFNEILDSIFPRQPKRGWQGGGEY